MIVARLRYDVALIFLISTPPTVCAWLLIHPLIRLWRMVGAGWSYAALALPAAVAMVAMWQSRNALLATEYGTRYLLLVPALVCLTAAGWLGAMCEQRLTYRVLLGLEEMSALADGKLLVDGIYSRIRHPRYLQVSLFIAGCALFANYLALYITAASVLPVLHLVVLLEERELSTRFGEPYTAYCRRVPRYFPQRAR